jgi:hypothetical protein
LLLLAATGAAPPQAPIAARATIDPGIVHLGEPTTYRGHVVVWPNASVRWLVPEGTDALTWGDRQAGRASSFDASGAHRPQADTVSVTIPLQAFQLGRLPVPGLRVEIDDGSGPRVFRLPTVNMTVVPVLTAADSNADFRAVHGPLAAPWWERVPWTWVVLGLLGAASIVALVVWRRRRRRVPAGTPVAGPQFRDPSVEALAALEALRGLHLPEHGRFAEHAFRLGQILRRYLEAVTRTTRPGDSTPELLAHLRQAGLESDDLARLSGLLRAWDQVKFAREPFTFDEAIRAERATEAFLQRPAAVAEKVA